MASGTDQSWIRTVIFGKENLPDPDWPTDHVPDGERRSLLSISAVLLGFVFFAGTLWSGAEVGAALGFGSMLTALAVGSAILGIYVATLCAIGAQTGLTTVLLSRYTFGRLGAKWADLLLGGTQVGWFGVTIPLVAIPTAKFFGVNTPTWVSALILLWGCSTSRQRTSATRAWRNSRKVAVRDGLFGERDDGAWRNSRW